VRFCSRLVAGQKISATVNDVEIEKNRLFFGILGFLIARFQGNN